MSIDACMAVKTIYITKNVMKWLMNRTGMKTENL